jgi:hypothetical protein
MEKKSIKIANAQGFLGDRQNAAAELIKNARDIDYITFDFLAELSMSILAIQQEKGKPAFATDFPEIMASLVSFWNEGLNFKVIANSGGLDPEACARATEEAVKGAGRPLKIAYVTGDNVLQELKDEKFVSANAYLGADVVKEALELGADIVITGRVADPSLTVGPCLYEFGWGPENLDAIAQSTVAGHLIECGTQVTGGICTKWLELEDPVHMGFPIAEIFADGRVLITKPEGTGGIVDIDTVKEQILYEISDPDHYISPDAVVSFSYLELEQISTNCVEVRNAKGLPATDTYKVVATYRNGYRAEALLVIYGDQAVRKGRRLGQVVLDRVIAQGHTFDDFVIECLGSGDAAPGPKDFSVPEIVLRVAVKGSYEALECFSKEIAPLVTSGPQGVSGYTTGRPKIREVFQYYPTLISKEKVTPQIHIWEAVHEPH